MAKNKFRENYYMWVKRGILKKQLKKIEENDLKKQLIREVNFFNESLIDLLVIGQPKTVEEALHLIESHFDLESIVNETEKINYSIGEAKLIFGHGNKNLSGV